MDCSKSYNKYSGVYEDSFLPFPISDASIQRIANFDRSKERLHKVVRAAQKNFQFATIYEQRKTNKILIDGFGNLGAASYSVGDRIEENLDELRRDVSHLGLSIDNWAYEVKDGFDDLRRDFGKMESKFTDIDETLKSSFHDQIERHDKTISLLDNIWRKKKPD